MQDEGFEQAVSEFVMAFDTIFRQDWEYARENFDCDYFISPGASFIEPGVADEDDDWKTRGVLLKRYRHLVSVMHERGISPAPPFPAPENQGQDEAASAV